jgi:hypothetical protein
MLRERRESRLSLGLKHRRPIEIVDVNLLLYEKSLKFLGTPRFRESKFGLGYRNGEKPRNLLGSEL